MRIDSRILTLALLSAAQFAVFLALLAPSEAKVEAGHTFSGGDCWQSGTPLQCRTNWEGPGKNLKLRIIDQMNNSGINHPQPDGVRKLERCRRATGLFDDGPHE